MCLSYTLHCRPWILAILKVFKLQGPTAASIKTAITRFRCLAKIEDSYFDKNLVQKNPKPGMRSGLIYFSLPNLVSLKILHVRCSNHNVLLEPFIDEKQK